MQDAESHPIPQDVTGFQFKIIGDITVKQFVYLAAPSFLAWIFFQLPISQFIRLPISILLGGLGISLAFIPIDGRPMDVMVTNFIKALFNPTRLVYQSKGNSLFPSTVPLSLQKTNVQRREKVPEPPANESSNILRASRFSQMTKPNEPNDKQTTPPLAKSQPITTAIHDSPSTPHIISIHPVTSQPQNVLQKPTPQALGKIKEEKEETLKRKVAALEKDLEAVNREKTTLEQHSPTFSTPKETKEILQLERQLQETLVQKEQLIKQLVNLQQKLDLQKKNFFFPTIAKAKTQTENVRQVPKGMGKSVGLPIAPVDPNIITGIIKDPRGNPLGSILVEIKDSEGNPVRAFKTNGLGQFASATPLTNGVYIISFEDPRGQNKFDAIEFTAKGEVILPIEVMSIDAREELRKALFKEN